MARPKKRKNPQVMAALIGGGATVVAALITAWFAFPRSEADAGVSDGIPAEERILTLYNGGVQHYNSGAYKAAEENFRQALKIAEAGKIDAPGPLDYLGRTLYKLGRDREAEGYLRTAIEVDPERVTARRYLGETLLEQRAYQEAAAVFEVAIDMAPDYPELHEGLGTANHALGKWAAAENEHRTAVNLDPSFGSAHYGLARALCRQGRCDEAMMYLEAAVDIDPRFRQDAAQDSEFEHMAYRNDFYTLVSGR